MALISINDNLVHSTQTTPIGHEDCKDHELFKNLGRYRILRRTDNEPGCAPFVVQVNDELGDHYDVLELYQREPNFTDEWILHEYIESKLVQSIEYLQAQRMLNHNAILK